MGRVCVLLLACCVAAWSGPVYSAADLVNSATNLPLVAGGAMVTITGKDLATGTSEFKFTEAQVGAQLPTSFPNTGVMVMVAGIPAPLLAVSPEKVTFLIPFEIAAPVDINIWLTVNGARGDVMNVHLYRAAPGLFLTEPELASASHKDGTPVSADAPALPGEQITVYANALGPTSPMLEYVQIPMSRMPLEHPEEFRVLLNGKPVDPAWIGYAGLAPGLPGTYRIEFTIPEDTPGNPEIRVATGDSISPEGVKLLVKELAKPGLP